MPDPLQCPVAAPCFPQACCPSFARAACSAKGWRLPATPELSISQPMGVPSSVVTEKMPGGGASSSVAESLGIDDPVQIPGTAEDDIPTVRPLRPEMPAPGESGRYQLLGEIARGGMGAVLKGRDPDLGRDLAVKVLLEAHRERPELVRRFVEEAQIGGQLQHPGIVPVYELGHSPTAGLTSR